MFNKPLFSSSAPISTCSNLTCFLFSKHALLASVNCSPNAFRYSDCAVRPCCVHGVLRMVCSYVQTKHDASYLQRAV